MDYSFNTYISPLKGINKFKIYTETSKCIFSPLMVYHSLINSHPLCKSVNFKKEKDKKVGMYSLQRILQLAVDTKGHTPILLCTVNNSICYRTNLSRNPGLTA